MPPVRPARRDTAVHDQVMRNREAWALKQAAEVEPVRAPVSTEVAVPYYIDVMTMPEPEQIDGAALLTHTAQWMGTTIVFPSIAEQVKAVLWNVHALARDRGDKGIGPLIWRATPRLGITSKGNRSGKTTLLDASCILQGTTRPVKITGRSLANKIGNKHETLMLDEAKLLVGSGEAARDVQSILLSGYTPRGTWEYGHGGGNVEIPVFGPAAYAAKDEIITATRDRLADLFDRTIWITMTRPTRLVPQMDEDFEDDGALIRQSLIDWTTARSIDLRMRAKELARLDYEASAEAASDGREIDARRPQIWRPLLAVADVAGGPWPILARRAMNEITSEAAERAALIADKAERWGKFDTEMEA